MTTDHAHGPGTDYCPHCCCTHVIGEHPRDGETESQYWQRMNRLQSPVDKREPAALLINGQRHSRSATP